MERIALSFRAISTTRPMVRRTGPPLRLTDGRAPTAEGVGEYVMNENDVLQNGRRAPSRDVVAFGSYSIGTHAH
jgi:hypothetical protein